MTPVKTEPEAGQTPAQKIAEPHAASRPERQAEPRSWETPPAPVPPPHFDDYQSIVGPAVLDELRYLAKNVKGKSLKMVNSTAVGGGVAEMLNRLVPLLGELDVVTHWDVITGGQRLFRDHQGLSQCAAGIGL